MAIASVAYGLPFNKLSCLYRAGFCTREVCNKHRCQSLSTLIHRVFNITLYFIYSSLHRSLALFFAPSHSLSHTHTHKFSFLSLSFSLFLSLSLFLSSSLSLLVFSFGVLSHTHTHIQRERERERSFLKT